MKRYLLVSCMVLSALLGGANPSWAISTVPDMDRVENDIQAISISVVGESVFARDRCGRADFVHL